MKKQKSIWVFGDYRNYYQNRVTLQLIARAVDLAREISAEVCAVVVGHDLEEWIWEYTSHGADRILAIDHPSLTSYSTEHYLALMEKLARERDPDIILIGATDFGREFAPRLAKRLKTGLSRIASAWTLHRKVCWCRRRPPSAATCWRKLSRSITGRKWPRCAQEPSGKFPTTTREPPWSSACPCPPICPRPACAWWNMNGPRKKSIRLKTQP